MLNETFSVIFKQRVFGGIRFYSGIRVHRHSNNAKKNTADMELPLKVPLAKFSFEKKGTKL